MASVADKPAPASPDYVTNPDAVLSDRGVEWRYGKPPDYSKTRLFWEETKKHDHAPNSLEAIVENLVKNWEIEASFKKRLSDWRTVNHDKYTFAIHGGQPQGAEEMLKIGTYNAIILPNEYYDPATTDFAQSHKTFKRMMPTFAWSVVEVYSPPPRISFKWRHWGVMVSDYCGRNNKGEKVTAKAHGGMIEITGITIADIDENLKVTGLKTYFDSMQMFRQIVGDGEVIIEKLDETKETLVTTGHGEGVITSAAGPMSSDGRSDTSSHTSKATRSVGFVLPQEQEAERLRELNGSGSGNTSRGSDTSRPQSDERKQKMGFTRLASKLGLSGGKSKKSGITPDVARDAQEAYHLDMPHDKIHPVLEHAAYTQASDAKGEVPIDHQGYGADPHAQLGHELGSLNIQDCPVMSGMYKDMGQGLTTDTHAK